jgi:uncharacterized protein (DUF2236 family)
MDLPAFSKPIFTPALRAWVVRAFPREPGGIDYEQPRGDPGLFGPDSATWQVHADFVGMLSGGLCALMLQTLHPAVLAGVWDHSNFREDLVGRLRRTTNFVAGTTYAGTEAAQALIARVRRIHAQVRGVTETGEPYDAEDPQLLTWVHVTEAFGFLEGYRRSYGPVTRVDADRYYDETRRVAEALGAREVPRSEADVRSYFALAQPRLAFTERTRTVLQVLQRMRLPVPLSGPSRDLFLGTGEALLPEWAIDHLRIGQVRRLRAWSASGVLCTLAPLFRAALKDGPAQRACRRVGKDPSWVRRPFVA